jgi:hypothetical protein
MSGRAEARTAPRIKYHASPLLLDCLSNATRRFEGELMKTNFAYAALRALCLLGLAACASTVWGQAAPVNDTYSGAINIPDGMPFTDSQPSISSANNIEDPTDPYIICKQSGPSGNPTPAGFTLPQGQMRYSVWYTYTTGTSVEYVNMRAMEAGNNQSNFDPVIAVWTGSQGSLRMVTGGCNDDGVPNGTNAGANSGTSIFNNYARIAGLRLQPNTTYSIEVAFNPSAGMALTAAQSLKFDMNAATVFTVDRTDDPVPLTVPATGLGPWNPCTPGNCSIRAAIEAAFIAGDASWAGGTGPLGIPVPGAAVIIPAGTYSMSAFAAPANGTDPSNNANVGGGDFDVNGSMGIYGAGMGQTIINPPLGDRVFDLEGSISWTATTAPPTMGLVPQWARANRIDAIVADMTLNGPGANAGSGPPLYTGSGNVNGGLLDDAIHPNPFHALERIEFINGFTRADGGAVYLATKAQIRDCRFTNNTAMNTTPGTLNNTGSGGALVLAGGGLSNFVEVSDTTFTGNRSFAENTNSYSFTFGGGAIWASGVYLALTNSTLSSNTANGFGGALVLDAGSGGTVADIRSTTIADNTADVNGNGIGAAGGGVYVNSATSAQPAGFNMDIITNTVIADNMVATDGTGADSECATTPFVTGAPQVLMNSSYNLIKAAGTGVCAFPGNGNLTGLDPLLAALADNGGATTPHPLTQALQPGSPAVDAGNPNGCTGHFGRVLTNDERGSGFDRQAGLRCDMGAVEFIGLANPPGVPAMVAASDTGDSQTDNLTSVNKPTFTGTCAADGDTVTVFADNSISIGAGICASNTYTATLGTALADGAHAIKAYESSATAMSPNSAALSITIDTIGPAITFTSTPPVSATDQDSEFDFTVEDNRPSQCQLDGGAFADCDGTWFETVGLGTHTFVVRAFDAAGAAGTASYTWTIGVADAPGAPVLAAASDSGSSSSDGITKSDPLAIQDTCTSGDSIQLYDGPIALGSALVCANGAVSFNVAGLAEGSHAITATATRGTTAESAHSAASTIVVDHTAPVLTLDGTPQASMISTSATFTFHTDDASPATCQLDGGTAAACTSPQTYSGLALGAHTFVIVSTDLAGNAAAAQTFSWSVVQPNASGAPMLAPSDDSGRSNADGVTNAAATAFIGACTDGDSIQLYDGNATVGPAATCSGGAYNIALSGLAEGSHSMTVTSTRNGIESAKSPATAVVIDRTPPSVPSLTGNGEPVELTVTVSGLAEPNALVTVLDGVTPVCAAVADAEANFSCSGALAGGDVRSLTASAADLAGNASASSAAYQVTADHDRVFRNGFGD